MAYFLPYIDNTGLHIPTYADIINDMVTQTQNIYGANIYLSPDSQDYQLLSVFALKIYDEYQTMQLVYNNRGPSTAIGSALDSIVKLNGLKRKSASYSSCVVTLTGNPNTSIINGVISDVNGNKWNLGSLVTIGSGGTVTVTAVCQTLGAITANPGDLNVIATPTAGWSSVTNANPAVVGQPVETDAQLKQRQTISTAGPSQTPLAGTIAAIAGVSGVTRYTVYENDTGVPDVNGLPAHSVTAVVEGGADLDIANALYLQKTPGCYTNGSTLISITDALGNQSVIRFTRPSYTSVDVAISIHPLTGYTTATTAAIQTAVANYINSLSIGQLLTISGIEGAVLGTMLSLTKPLFSIRALTAGLHGGSLSSSDIVITYNQASQTVVGQVTVTLV